MRKVFKIVVNSIAVVVLFNVSVIALNEISKVVNKQNQINAWRKEAKRTLGEGEASMLVDDNGMIIKVISKKNGKLIDHVLNDNGEWVPKK